MTYNSNKNIQRSRTTSRSFWDGLGEACAAIAQAMVDSGRCKVIADRAAMEAFDLGASTVSVTIDGFHHVYTREEFLRVQRERQSYWR